MKIHGHNYIFFFFFKGDINDSSGFIVDLQKLNEICKKKSEELQERNDSSQMIDEKLRMIEREMDFD